MSRAVTERDLRAPEFTEGEPEEYEFRADGKIVRKDRWERGIVSIVSILGWSRRAYEIPEVVDEVRKLAGVRVQESIATARDVYEGNADAIECLDYLQALLDTQDVGAVQ